MAGDAMELRYLGRTGVRVSPLCLGTMTYGDRTDLEEACAIVDRALEAGINFIDTANVYVGGRSEEVVGEALARNGHRDWVVLASKCHGNMHKDPGESGPAEQRLRARLNPNRWGNSRRQIVEQCEASLRRLKTDRIDLYQIHRPHPDCAIDETLRALDQLVRQGKVLYLGCSTFAAWQVVEAHWTAERYALNRFVTEQPPYHLLDRRIERELVPMARTYGMAILPWSPLAGGFLTGKYARDGANPEDGRLEQRRQRGQTPKPLEGEAAFDVVDGLRALAGRKGCNLAQLALAWCRDQPGVTSPIIGPRTRAQLEDNLGAMAVTITGEERAEIDQLSPPGTATVPFYEAQFGPHPHRV